MYKQNERKYQPVKSRIFDSYFKPMQNRKEYPLIN